MKAQQTYYEALGLLPGVSTLEIKQAYRALVKNHHPDLNHSANNVEQINLANERMRHLNEAYSTLIDKKKRAEYDVEIGLTRFSYTFTVISSSRAEEEAHLRFMKVIFNPARRAIYKVLRRYPEQLHKLSADIYDSELLSDFEIYIEELDDTLRKSATLLNSEQSPRLLEAAVRMMGYSLAQAADGLEETRHFCQNFNYDHLVMAENLFRISLDLSRESVRLARI
jgi:molecular chaperone DnaJ